MDLTNAAVYAWSIYLMHGFVARGERKWLWLAAGASLPVCRLLYQGQSSAILVLGAALIARGLLGRRPLTAGLGFALFLIKPHLLPLIILLAVRWRSYRALFWFVLWGVAIGGVSLALVGINGLFALADLVLGGTMALQFPWRSH